MPDPHNIKPNSAKNDSTSARGTKHAIFINTGISQCPESVPQRVQNDIPYPPSVGHWGPLPPRPFQHVPYPQAMRPFEHPQITGPGHLPMVHSRLTNNSASSYLADQMKHPASVYQRDAPWSEYNSETRPVLLKDIVLSNPVHRQGLNNSEQQTHHTHNREHIFLPRIPFTSSPRILFPQGPQFPHGSTPLIHSDTYILPHLSVPEIYSSRYEMRQDLVSSIGTAKEFSGAPEDETKDIVRFTEPNANTTVNHPTFDSKKPAKGKISNEAKDAYKQLIPLLSTVNSQNFGMFIAHVLRQWHHHVTIDEVYKLLYSQNPLEKLPQVKCDNSKSLVAKQSALEVLQLIIQTFKTSEPDPVHSRIGSLQYLKLSVENFHEFLRQFLAFKILFSCVKKPKSRGRFTIPRNSLYKAYYILCQKVIGRYSSTSDYADKAIVLGQSHIGKVIRCVHPNIQSKRLGSRGHSKAHYIDICWNESVIDQDILALLHLDISQIQEHFKNKKRTTDHSSKTFSNRNPPKVPHATTPATYPVCQDSLATSSNIWHSFFNLAHTFPDSDCSPRNWALSPNDIPKVSMWGKEQIERSLLALKVYNFDFLSFLNGFSHILTSEGNSEYLSNGLVTAMNVFLNCAAPHDAYKNLYLIVLLQIFPMIVASNQEMALEFKVRLRHSIDVCVETVEAKSSKFTLDDKMSAMAFTRILRKMSHLNEMTSRLIKASYAEDVLNEMLRKIQAGTSLKNEDLNNTPDSECRYVQAITMSMHANNFKFSGENFTTDDETVMQFISTVAHNLRKRSTLFAEIMSSIPAKARADGLKGVAQDLPYQLFKLASEIFHKGTLADPMVLKLPIPVAYYMMSHLSNPAQYLRFQSFGKTDKESSNESFRCWCLFITMFNDYTGIISEVVALNEQLAKRATKASDGISEPVGEIASN